MCFTRRKKRERKKSEKYRKNRVVPVRDFTPDEHLLCHGCRKCFRLEDMKIHCAGCNNFFHCCIAGKCIGKNCNDITMDGEKHTLSWCIYCVPGLPQNKVNGQFCICGDCHQVKS